MAVNGLPLPEALLAAMGDGRWVAPDLDAQRRVFGEAHGDALFYPLEFMRQENAAWPGDKGPIYFGDPDPSRPPGDIDPARSVLIADLGPDRMVALDYRTSPDTPAVVFLGSREPGWVQVAGSAAELLDLLGR